METSDIRVDGESVGGGKLTIREMEIELPDGTVKHLSEDEIAVGTATSVVIPREAMGIGDVHLLGMIGAFFGWTGVFFSLFAASVFAIIAAVIGRIGFGKQLPFGPFLAMGAVTWAFGGWQIWAWYLDFLGPIWECRKGDSEFRAWKPAGRRSHGGRMTDGVTARARAGDPA